MAMSGKPSLEHGGRLNAAARQWNIPREQWLDLSTGINPVSWPVPALPETVWQRLPEDDDGLEDAVRLWAGAPDNAGCLPIPGSQAAIQRLPRLRPSCRVGVPVPGYEEHARCWAQAGHTVVPLAQDDGGADDWLDELDVVVWINPNNPSGERIERQRLLHWHERLQSRGGWLVVDEAFLLPDEPGESLAPVADRPGLVILKSLGKFFGLAGIRAGAALGDADIVSALATDLGPWALSTPARFIMARALADAAWQTQTIERLRADSRRLAALLTQNGFPVVQGTALFQYAPAISADAWADALAQRGVYVRRFAEPAALRFGLPATESDWRRLQQALQEIQSERVRNTAR